ncbi:hypothetical protein V6N11_037556 [Hibiscus sabdariffa]|uniref:F-box domain-containing protein n=1 Tax=Hibiscus sabdariffa TaxID=183260 RepID=A0ABR2P1Z0_9ROSI
MVLPSTIERMPKKKFRKYLYNSEHDGNSIDRLSGLPQDLLVRILSSLSLKEAVRTCVLSRRWRDLCQFFSGSLNFDASKTLKSDPKKLLKERDVKKCERLELDFEPCRLNHRRDSENYRLGHKFSSSSETRFLTGLCLKHVNVSGRILESFLSNCPLLETLHVSHSEELTHISVCGSSLRLKYLHVSFCKCIKSIEVCAPNLVTFEHRGEENMTVHIDLKYVPHLCDVSYAGQWDFPRVNDRAKSIPSCLATSQLVNLSISIPYTPRSRSRSVVNSPIQPKFSNLRCLTLEFLKFHLPILHTVTFVNACQLFTHMPLLHKFKVELEAVEAHILTEVEEFQSVIWAVFTPYFRTWIRAKPGLGNLDNLVNAFRTPPLTGKKIEFSVASALIPDIPASEMHGVYAEIQLPTTLVPTRYFEFLRYGKEIMDGVHIIVGVTSHCFGDPYARYNSEKRPSGVIIREYGRKDCEIIWIENVEVEETRETMYSSIINSNLAYNADRWISTLLWKLKRDRSCFPGLKIDVHPRAGSFLLALTQAMKRFFMECVSQHPDEVALTIATSDADPIRIMYNQTLTERIALVGVNSFRVQAKPLSFRASANSEIDEVHEEPEQLFTFASDDKSNIISLHKRNTEQQGTSYCLQEVSMDKYCSFILSKTMPEDLLNFHIVCREESIYETSDHRMANVTPSGFAIMPDGPGGLQSDASLVTFLMQLDYDPLEGDVHVDTVRKRFSRGFEYDHPRVE